jgi:Flp pilus assembly protein TadG
MRLNSKIGEQKGAAATEFAIVLPLLIVLVFGIIEFSILLYDKAMITNASREGSRAGIVYAYPDRISDDDITAVINTYCSTHLITFSTGARLPPTITILRTGTSAGDSLTVTVKYKYDFLVLPNFIASLVGGIEIAGETIMRME